MYFGRDFKNSLISSGESDLVYKDPNSYTYYLINRQLKTIEIFPHYYRIEITSKFNVFLDSLYEWEDYFIRCSSTCKFISIFNRGKHSFLSLLVLDGKSERMYSPLIEDKIFNATHELKDKIIDANYELKEKYLLILTEYRDIVVYKTTKFDLVLNIRFDAPISYHPISSFKLRFCSVKPESSAIITKNSKGEIKYFCYPMIDDNSGEIYIKQLKNDNIIVFTPNFVPETRYSHRYINKRTKITQDDDIYLIKADKIEDKAENDDPVPKAKLAFEREGKLFELKDELLSNIQELNVREMVIEDRKKKIKVNMNVLMNELISLYQKVDNCDEVNLQILKEKIEKL